MRRGGQRIVLLSDLTRYIFTSQYEAQRGPQGEDELCFQDPKGGHCDSCSLFTVTEN